MKMTDEQFNKLLLKTKTPKEEKKYISDAEFSALLSKAKTFKMSNTREVEIKKITKKKSSAIPLYKKLVDLYERVIDDEPKKIIKEPKKKQVITIQEVRGLPKILMELAEMRKKIEVYERYISNGQGGPGIVFHDTSLSGTGVPGDPLSVTGGASSNIVFGEVVAGSNTTFTLAHVPSGTISLAANGQVLTLAVDYTIAGAIITTLSVWSAGSVIADYKY